MLDYKHIFKKNPFSMKQSKKEKWFLNNQKILSNYHFKNCAEYKNIANSFFKKTVEINNSSELPYVHAEIFKEYNLTSINKTNLTNSITSSGTSSKNKSIINLDLKTSLIQSKALSMIFREIIRDRNSEIFFIDIPQSVTGTLAKSARGTAIKGFSQLVLKSSFILDNNFRLNIKRLTSFVKKYPKKEFVIFGFTSFVWDNLIKELKRRKIRLPKNNGILIHGGGWKKMKDESVSKKLFNSTVEHLTGVKSVLGYYGMVEQTGSIFIECEYGHYHCSIYSEIFIRDENLKLLKLGKEGLVQVLSLLPISSPGHNILTEDIGKIIGVDDCKCGRKGKYFSIKGRVKGTELRGCSDVY